MTNQQKKKPSPKQPKIVNKNTAKSKIVDKNTPKSKIVDKNTPKSKIVHVHNHIYANKNGKSSGCKTKTRNMGCQVPRNGLRCGFKKIIEDKNYQTDIDKNLNELDTASGLFNSLDQNLAAVDCKIENFMRAKTQEEITLSKSVLTETFGQYFQSKTDFIESIQFKNFSFEYLVWRHFCDYNFEIDDILSCRLTRKFINKFFTGKIDIVKFLNFYFL